MSTKNRSQKLAVDPAAKTIVETNLRLLVLEGIVAGKKDSAMAAEFGVPLAEIKEAKRDVAATLPEGYHDEKQYVVARASARLEEMFEVARLMALGKYKFKADKDPSGIPDRQWMRLAADIAMKQVDLYRADESRAAEKPELNFTAIQQITITSKDEMYEHARESMWQQYHGITPGEMEQMLLTQVSSAAPKKVDLDEMRQKLDDILLIIPPEGEDDES